MEIRNILLFVFVLLFLQSCGYTTLHKSNQSSHASYDYEETYVRQKIEFYGILKSFEDSLAQGSSYPTALRVFSPFAKIDSQDRILVLLGLRSSDLSVQELVVKSGGSVLTPNEPGIQPTTLQCAVDPRHIRELALHHSVQRIGLGNPVPPVPTRQ